MVERKVEGNDEISYDEEVETPLVELSKVGDEGALDVVVVVVLLQTVEEPVIVVEVLDVFVGS